MVFKITSVIYELCCLWADIVETTFVVSRFSDIRKETTSFLAVPKKNRNDARLVSDLKSTQPGMTRNDQERPGTNQLMVESCGRG